MSLRSSSIPCRVLRMICAPIILNVIPFPPYPRSKNMCCIPGHVPMNGSPSFVVLKVPHQAISVSKGTVGNKLWNFFSSISVFFRRSSSLASYDNTIITGSHIYVRLSCFPNKTTFCPQIFMVHRV